MTFRLYHHPVQAGDLTKFLLQLIICCLLESYWVNPFPGASFGINHFFSYIAQAMVAAFDQSSLDSLLQLLKTAGDQTQMPSFTAPVQILCYFFVQILLGLASAILFLINCSPFILERSEVADKLAGQYVVLFVFGIAFFRTKSDFKIPTFAPWGFLSLMNSNLYRPLPLAKFLPVDAVLMGVVMLRFASDLAVK